MATPIHSEATLVNGSGGDPVLYVDYPDRDNALLFDAGDVAALPRTKLADLDAVFLTHHHPDHFMDLDRVVRANLDSSKTLNVFGPVGTIARVYDRIRSYAHSYFPFQKLVIEVNDLREDGIDRCHLEYQRKFPEPTIEQRPFLTGGVIFENKTVQVRAAPTQHTVPGWAYCLSEKSGFRFDYSRLRKSSLKPGPWIGKVLNHLESPGDRKQTPQIQIDGGVFSVKQLAEKYFRRGGGFRMAWMVDTSLQDTQIRADLHKLVSRVDRFYCDCFYTVAQQKSAAKHLHLTTKDVAEFAVQAKVKDLVLVHFSQRYQGKYEKLLREVQDQLTVDGINVRYIS